MPETVVLENVLEKSSTTRAEPPINRRTKTRHFLKEFVRYPTSDGEPMSDSDDQYEAMTDGKFGLMTYFQNNPNVYVGANLLIYYEEGDNTKKIAPDIFVIFGVPKRKRGSYKVWLERKLPSIVFEVASPGTWKKDLNNIRLYESLHIPEYILLDPFGEYFGHALSGYRYANESYQRIPYLTSAEGVGIYSEQLGLEIWTRAGNWGDSAYLFRFRDPKTGEWLLTQLETDEAYRRERTSRKQAEEQAKRDLEARDARLAELEAELKRLRGEAKQA